MSDSSSVAYSRGVPHIKLIISHNEEGGSVDASTAGVEDDVWTIEHPIPCIWAGYDFTFPEEDSATSIEKMVSNSESSAGDMPHAEVVDGSCALSISIGTIENHTPIWSHSLNV